jgi:ribosomal protein S18 acetylase RimI-like enzyme
VIRPFEEADWPAVWAALELVFRAGETYAVDPAITEEGARAYWLAPEKQVLVAEVEGKVAGTYYLRANQDGPGAHVANCGYVVHPAARGRGLASAMCEDSLERAREQGFRWMQFNLVASSNEGAVRLWKKHGFAVVGTLPGAFHHPRQGDVDAFVMTRRLEAS